MKDGLFRTIFSGQNWVEFAGFFMFCHPVESPGVFEGRECEYLCIGSRYQELCALSLRPACGQNDNGELGDTSVSQRTVPQLLLTPYIEMNKKTTS